MISDPARLTAGVAPPFGRVRMRDRLSLRVQLVLLTGSLASLVAIGLVVVVQVCLAGASNNAVTRVLHDRAGALVAGIEAASPGGDLHVPRKQLGPGVAVYDGHGSQVAGSVPPSLQGTFATLALATDPAVVDVGEQYAVMAEPFTTGSGTRGVAVLTEPRAPYERDEQAALVVSIVGGMLLVLVAAGSAAWISRRALHPVAHMARTAEEWSEHDLERRFDLGPPTNEIRALGHTLDGLLEKVAHVIRSEQRLSSELAHELRTPLTAVQGLAELLAARSDLDPEAHADVAMIRAACTEMSNTIAILLELAHQQGAAGAYGECADLNAVEGALKALPHPDGRLYVDFTGHLTLDLPPGLVLRALAPVIDNAMKLSERVDVRAQRRGRVVDILVADDGPGVGPEVRDHLFAPGWSNAGGSGLGLSLARRIARAAGGDVTLREDHNERGGATFAVSFPTAARLG